MSVQTIADIYPALANTKAFRSPSQSVDQIASELTRIIRPDIYENFLRRQIFEQMVASAKPKVGTIAHLKPGKIGTGRLTAQQRVRAKLVNYILADVLPWPLERSLQAYSQDVYPVNELHKWERIAASYLDTIRGMVLSPEKRREIFLFILGASSNMLTNDVRRGFKHLSVPEMQEILTAMNNVVPREPAPEVALEQEESTHDEA